MTWKLTKQAESFEPLPGVPWADMPDEDFRRIEASYAKDNGFPAHALRDSGFFEHVEDPKPAEEKH